MTITPRHKKTIITTSLVVIVLCFLVLFISSLLQFLSLQRQTIAIGEANSNRLACLALIKPDDRTPKNVQDCFNKNKLPGSTKDAKGSSAPTTASTSPAQVATSHPTSKPTTKSKSPKKPTPPSVVPPTPNCTIDILAVHLICK